MRIDEYIRLVARNVLAFILALMVCLMLDATMGCSRKTTSMITDRETTSTYSCDSTTILKADSTFAITLSSAEGWWERNDSIVEYSAPDSMGNQYVVRKRISVARGGDARRDSASQGGKSYLKVTENKNDSSYSYINKVETRTSKVAHTTPWYVHLILIVIVVFILHYSVRWLKEKGILR